MSLVAILTRSSPAAVDVPAALRLEKVSGVLCAVTADVKEAHRQVKVRPEDQACHLVPGGPAYLSLVGTKEAMGGED